MSNFAMVFPGQGSQAVGMLAELATEFPIVEQVFAEASEVLGYDLWALVQHGTAEELSQTQRTQPALLAASVAIYRVWQQKYPELKPAMMAGHSLGEYSALVCAGVLNFQDAIKLVELRGNAMQQAVPAGSGAMYAIIGLENNLIINACQQAQLELGEVVSAVNFNSPGQVAIAGSKTAVEKAAELCKTAGAKRALPLAVSVPSHCSLMKPAAEELAAALQNISLNPPRIPVIHNVNVAVETDVDAIRERLVEQLYSPVRWSETIEKMAEQGIDTLFEMGPNKVLTGLAGRIAKQLTAKAINDIASLAAVQA
ncbi:malonyl CoA-acyl carrier protein transacylase [[Haemophilus] ducreyi]|uniref:Malonyl CoA-acyl carrier protein transacylase n=2 Tax=Haemophilus ducreyi TaxID=730 RepID=Q7VN69_HAEDU|nr:ACP S-malonyltransferase [[Haemophilus] ducreyi]AAP95623.1 malonyl CoA-acyl carrier protein transacylase [[Haemophilus] ducreyi 35000HP]AKO30694.1 malonyl CoA-ACP transacylase [[Haemophilus] ducreyi]AKO32133.1 malonyl CoA-ACP transacylase [[Haemophilus] ducreyi]AKO35034.1 malonyl CoA-ACP transacylase [[Haemophilus] ducreyi]AKO36466.1 malonyl CoA-ACP transacylase [[Haemophilus] ducreyi]